MKHVLLTGGGTAGHVTPHLALLPELKALGFEVHYAGQKQGIERDIIVPLGLPYHGLNAGKLRRYFDLKNVTDLFRIGQGFLQALFLMRKLRPQLVFSKGGFVTCPVVWAAWLNRVPVIIHESDLTPGLANRLSIPFAKQVCYSFPETEQHLPVGKGTHTGIPIRPALLQGEAETGKKLCGFNDNKPVLLFTGGSLGAGAINQALRAALADLLAQFNICHLCGQGNLEDDLNNKPGYKQFAYVDAEYAHLLAMADLVVSRAGATTLFELLALQKPNLLIPLPLHASRGDQILNAESFQKQGFSQALAEDDLTALSLEQGHWASLHQTGGHGPGHADSRRA